MNTAAPAKPTAVAGNPYKAKAKVVNPYLKSKPELQQASNASKISAPQPKPVAPTSKQIVPPEATGNKDVAVPPAGKKNVSHSEAANIVSPPLVEKVPSTETSIPSKAPTKKASSAVAACKRQLSLKSKLRQELEAIRKATELEKKQKQLKREQKALDKQRREQERLLAKEEEKRRRQQKLDEERHRRLMEEQEKLRQERLKLEQERKQKAEDDRRKKREEEQRRRILLAQQQQMQQNEASENIGRILKAMHHHREYMAAWGREPYNVPQNDAVQSLQRAVDQALPKNQDMRICMISNLEQHHGGYGYGDRLLLLALLRQQPLTNIGWEDILHPTESMYPYTQQIHHLYHWLQTQASQPYWNTRVPVHPQYPPQAPQSSLLPHPFTPAAMPGPVPDGPTPDHACSFAPAATDPTPLDVKIPTDKEKDDIGKVQTISGLDSRQLFTVKEEKKQPEDAMHDPQQHLMDPQTTMIHNSSVVAGHGREQQMSPPTDCCKAEVTSESSDSEQLVESQKMTPPKLSTPETSTPTLGTFSTPTVTPTQCESNVTVTTALTGPTLSVTNGNDASSAVGINSQMPESVLSAIFAEPAIIQSPSTSKLPHHLAARTTTSEGPKEGGPMVISPAPVPSSTLAATQSGTPSFQPHSVPSHSTNASSNHLDAEVVSPAMALLNSWNRYQPHGIAGGIQHLQSQPWQAHNYYGHHAVVPPPLYPPYTGHYNGGHHPYQSQPMAMHPYSTGHQWPGTFKFQYTNTPLPANGIFSPPYGHNSSRAAHRPKAPRAPRERKPKLPIVQRLAFNPIAFPSPYAITHALLIQIFVVVKKPGESFGIALQEDKQSALVEIEWFTANEARMKKATIGTEDVASSGDSIKVVGLQRHEESYVAKGNQSLVDPVSKDLVNQTSDRLNAFSSETQPRDTLADRLKEKKDQLEALPAETKGKNEGSASASNDKALDKQEQMNPYVSVNPPAANERVLTAEDSEHNLSAEGKLPTTVEMAVDAADDVNGKDIHDVARMQKRSNSYPPPEVQSVRVNQSHSFQHWAQGDKTSSSIQPPKPRKRRKRNFFAVMMVADASVQNERIASEMNLQKGDIIVSVNGVAPGGLVFKEACLLFGNGCIEKENEKGEKWIECSLTIARRKPPPAPKIKLPPALPLPKAASLGQPTLVSDVPALKRFTDKDVTMFAACVLKTLFDPERMLGAVLSDKLLRKYVEVSLGIAESDFERLKTKWNATNTIDRVSSKIATDFWTKKWKIEKEKYHPSVEMKYLTDAKRAKMRCAPRPMKGCKCGSQDHEYVDDARCPLYSDILPLSNWDRKSREPERQKKGVKKGIESRQLNNVETAFRDRFIREQAEKKALEEEASFVAEMEDLQVKMLKKAVFAPSLTAMVLSAVFELQEKFPRNKTPNATSAHARDDTNMDDAGGVIPEECDDDEDIPLAALLGKREQSSADLVICRKKQKADLSISIAFLAEALRLISNRWGHVYREPDNVDYAWRWEVYHGSTGTECQDWGTLATNPRRAGSRSFENLRFVLTDDFMKALANQGPENNGEVHRAQVVVSHLSKPERTGVIDELLALHKFEIVRIKDGVPRPTNQWYTRVDLLLLNEMHECWSPVADKSGKYLVSNKMRHKLHEQWEASEYGWALREEADDIIFEYSEWDEWRNTFEEKQETKRENAHGIGRFGL